MTKNTKAKLVPLIRIDGTQVINIPENMEFDTDEVVIYKVGEAVIIKPRQVIDSPLTLEQIDDAELNEIADDRMAEPEIIEVDLKDL